jgi:predicted transposase
MKTLKLPYKTTQDFSSHQRQFNNVMRFSYNRFKENKSEKEIRLLTKSLENINLLNSWFVNCAILEGKAIHAKNKDKKVIFGGKANFNKIANKKITKEEFKAKRLMPVVSQGSITRKGNRMFKLDVIENNQIIFKFDRKNHFEFKLPKLRKNYKEELSKLQTLNEVKQGERGYTFMVSFDTKFVYITFEEFKETNNKLKKERCLGIDLNPRNIGISILENNQVIHTQEFSLKSIFDKIENSSLSSNSKKMKYFQNKLKFETLEISKAISLLALKFGCGSVYLEDLNFKGSKAKWKSFNRLTKNLWKRELFTQNLKKRLNVLNIQTFDVNPAYSSFIGNMQYDYVDSVNASIEIARRGFEYRIKGNKDSFYPNLSVKHQWKEMCTKYTDWKKFFIKIKNLKLKYRVSLEEVKYKFKVFQQNLHIVLEGLVQFL